ncbi:hypothetical protein [Nocardia pseudobrasiliensis]|uniref:Uncharacterized protein n=1 Tax=Nocardia pseudobrasiliensis TaxID=45979 RepID=A0A370IBG8_9NOCA|nr:hypothetical protein [Nocardia pseudobrasiliensis]RDI68079.1 hypothetical protein DFR76_102480 [Nocardia pseudobrasiliensis]
MTETPAAYSHWTRRALTYLPVHRRGVLIGYLWASTEQHAAGFERRLETAGNDLDCLLAWEARLSDAAAQGLSPNEAIRQWIGAPEDAAAGAVPAETQPGELPSLDELWTRLNPDGPPLGDGPLIQDGAYLDGTPADRRDGWGPLVSVPLRTYATETASPIRYLPVRLDELVAGYIWAAITGEAAGYLPRTQAGRAGEIAAGLWQLRMSDAYLAGEPATTALTRCRDQPADRLSGVVGADAVEYEASTLAELRDLAADAVSGE